MKRNSMLTFLKEKSFLIVLTLTLVSAGTMALLFTMGSTTTQPGSEMARQEQPKLEASKTTEEPNVSEEPRVSEIELLEKNREAMKNNSENAVTEAELEDQYVEAPENSETAQLEETESEAVSAGDVVAEEFSAAGSKSLQWPVQGDVLMEFSMDHSVYFQTLAQYQYNPAMIIKAEEGAPVVCAATGTVTEVGTTNEYGNYVTMDLGDGFFLTYGQLENVTTETGETLEAGKSIGTIAKPSRSYTEEGANLYLKLTKDGEPVNPAEYLEE